MQFGVQSFKTRPIRRRQLHHQSACTVQDVSKFDVLLHGPVNFVEHCLERRVPQCLRAKHGRGLAVEKRTKHAPGVLRFLMVDRADACDQIIRRAPQTPRRGLGACVFGSRSSPLGTLCTRQRLPAHGEQDAVNIRDRLHDSARSQSSQRERTGLLAPGRSIALLMPACRPQPESAPSPALLREDRQRHSRLASLAWLPAAQAHLQCPG